MAAFEKVNLVSMDIAEEKRKQLKILFPEVFTEDKVDFEQLKRALGEWAEPGKERFGLNWPGKAECMKLIQQPSIATLKPAREESVNFDETENLFIEGDNLEVLKLLQKSYFGKVKMIYIDPPYNTGKDFVYSDKFGETLDTYLEYTGQKDDKGRKLSTNTDTQGRYHSNWLNMMYPRLYLARNLLREDGVIFISIDDHEVHHLRKLCDELFGEENFVAQFIWQRAFAPKNDARYVSKSHDYILMYAKHLSSFTIGRLPRTKEMNERYKNPDNDPRGPWMPGDLSVKTMNLKDVYEIVSPSGRKSWPPPGRSWRVSQTKFFEKLADNRIWFGEKGDNVPLIKRFLSELKFEGIAVTSLLFHKDVGNSSNGTKEVVALMGEAVFDGPKPLRLLRRLLTIANVQDDDIVLDFFAGSGTTGDAVLQTNKEDGGTRKYILVQLPEPLDPTKGEQKTAAEFCEKHSLDLKITELSKERIRRAAKKITDAQNGQLDLNGTAALDLGFRVFKLARSNFKIWEGDVHSIQNLEQQLFDHIDHINEASTPEDILYELLLKSGFLLTTKPKTLTLAGKQVFSIEDGAMLICLDKALTQEVIDAIADSDPLQVICLDNGFKGNDQLKANAVQTFKARARDDESAIVFRTV